MRLQQTQQRPGKNRAIFNRFPQDSSARMIVTRWKTGIEREFRLVNPSSAQAGWAARDLIGVVGSTVGVHFAARASTKTDGNEWGSG
jgi:hypothetical protein